MHVTFDAHLQTIPELFKGIPADLLEHAQTIHSPGGLRRISAKDVAASVETPWLISAISIPMLKIVGAMFVH
jgi:hypothetical protein